MTDELRKQIVRIVGLSDYRKGSRFPKHYIDYQGHEVKGNKVYFNFEVESESSYRYYDVNFYKQGNMIAQRCSCPQFRLYDSCKHIAACLYYYGKEIFEFSIEGIEKKSSLEVLDYFNDLVGDTTIGSVKKELTLDLSPEPLYNNEYELKVKIGKDKTYIIKEKTRRFSTNL